ncbi:hypothetical protein BDZ97DRAFT_1651060 [Flammula alnicola]|nr:hypothetical protein BDZ97DRAFT_1651060 [Flammula alnicola]
MSSDGYFDADDDFDASALEQLDAIEAAHSSLGQETATAVRYPATSPIVPIKPTAPTPSKDASYDDFSFDVDESALAQLDTFIADSYQGKAKPVAEPSRISRTSSSNKLQTTLFGEVLQPVASTSSSKPKSQLERTKSAPRNPFGQQARKTKQWDQTAFAKTGIRKPKSSKGKGKEKGDEGDDDDGEEHIEFEQFPAPFVSRKPPPPMKVAADLLEAKHYIFPINRPKRDYQFNIVKNSLFENTLVALPTGLGKTFIAGVVMLNYHRWFPEGKVIFVAPTKPLVAQQVSACHETCGIPGGDSIELTGEVSAHVRARYWKEKRVFFMTPQTLVNDLLKENCDVRDIVLLVVDEAHRATGDYAYNQVIRFLMAKNPHFRVLALTATPGNNPEAVQVLIDGLHISRIEIRDEQSLDLKAYIHKKVFHQHIIKASGDLAIFRDLLVKVMDPLMKPVLQAGLFYPSDTAIKLHPYRPQRMMTTLKDRRLFMPLSMLSKLARLMLYLLTGSFKACYDHILEISRDQANEEVEGVKKKKASNKRLEDDPNFRAFVQEFENQHTRGFSIHPKIEKLKTILIQHFGSKLGDEAVEDDTKVMVFSSYRSVVEEIVAELDKERPLIRATQFIGQGVDKQGKKGLSQKEQLEVIKKFKAGEYNVLVATCIGEEGLDIGDIDLTVCYDADKAPTRMIQRFGRTGRKREGTIHALLAEGREEDNIGKAEATYREVQNLVNRGELYELYGDVERLLPDHIKPDCVEKVVEIEHYVREEGKKGCPKKGAAQGVKRKRNDDVSRNIPEGASTGFVSVRDLVVRGAKKPKKAPTLPKDFDSLGQDDETDEDIESGRIIAPRRTQSAAAAMPAKRALKSKLKKSATIGTNEATKSRQKKKVQEYTSSQFSRQGVDDSDDMDIEAGTLIPSLKTEGTAASKTPTPTSPTPEPSPKKRVDESVIELSDSDHPNSSPMRDRCASRSLDPISHNDPPQDDQNMGWLVDDDDDDRCDFEIVDSSPLAPKPPSAFERMQFGDDSIEITRPTPHDFFVETSDPLEPMMDDSMEFVEPELSTHGKGKVLSRWNASPPTQLPGPSLLSPSRKTNAPDPWISPSRQPDSSKTISSPGWNQSSSPFYPNLDNGKGKTAMLPPALPRRFLASPGDSGALEMPEPSFPIRALGNHAKRRHIVFDEPESPASELPPPSQRRLHRIESTPSREKPKDKTKPKRAKPSLLARNVNPLFDGEAAHSGDEVSEGYSDEDEESESDRLFIKNSPATQVSQSYDQSLIYRRSLLTQAPGDGQGPAFATRPIRPRPFGRIDGPRLHGGFLPSSSPPPPDDDLDHYHLGTFVVDDDEEISYEL